MARDKLTAKQALFVQEYLVDLHGKNAAIRAGYAPKKADSQASQLLKIPKVQTAIRHKQEKLAAKLEITAEKVLREMAAIGFANSGDYFEWGPLGVTLVPKEKLTREQQSAVAEASQTVTESGGTIRLKLHDKVAALTKLGQHLGLFAEKHKHEHSGPGGGPIELLTPEQYVEEIELIVRAIELRQAESREDAIAREIPECAPGSDDRREATPGGGT